MLHQGKPSKDVIVTRGLWKDCFSLPFKCAYQGILDEAEISKWSFNASNQPFQLAGQVPLDVRLSAKVMICCVWGGKRVKSVHLDSRSCVSPSCRFRRPNLRSRSICRCAETCSENSLVRKFRLERQLRAALHCITL
jgi:hypothetical protein